jgi:UDP-N-acetyl-D-mannosaminuronate dehydrogenase
MWRQLAEQKVLVVGLGEVGQAILDLLKGSGRFAVYGFDLDESKMRKTGQTSLPSKVDTMHICIPCKGQDEFVNAAVDYAKRFKPKLVIIDSTIPPGTTKSVSKRCPCLVAHSPFRGVHESPEHMKWELKRWTKYIGGANAEAGRAADKHFRAFGLRTKVLKSCAETELAKLFETTYRAWMITCFQEMHRVSRHFGADFDQVVDFLADTHRARFDRPIMFPDVIGRHCIIPNVELLLEGYDSKLLRLILESNEKRKEEIKDKEIREEVEKVKRIAEYLQQDLTKRP